MKENPQIPALWRRENLVILRKADHGQHGTRVTFLPIQLFKRADPIEKKRRQKIANIFHTEVHTFLNLSKNR